jgi:hypothetical protein
MASHPSPIFKKILETWFGEGKKAETIRRLNALGEVAKEFGCTQA